ncbi:MAG: hypothetical protein AAGF96_05860 [Bacteroidota bacterium]
MEKLTGFLKIQNWLGKLTLYIIAVVWQLSELYPHIMSNLFLTDREVPDWGTASDILVLTVNAAMILGGLFLNRLMEFFKLKK